MKKLLVFLLLLSPALAQPLEEKLVLLVVSEHRQDAAAQQLADRLVELRDGLGLTARDLPLVFMGFADPDTDPDHYRRLGFAAEDSPVVCVARWASEESYGPTGVVEASIHRRVDLENPDRFLISMLREWLETTGRQELVGRLPGPTVGTLSVDEFVLVLSGQPLYLGSLTVMLLNDTSAPAPAAPGRFEALLEGEWRSLAEFKIPALKPGRRSKQGLLINTQTVPGMLDPAGELQGFQGRLIVGEAVLVEGEFTPGTGWQTFGYPP